MIPDPTLNKTAEDLEREERELRQAMIEAAKQLVLSAPEHKRQAVFDAINNAGGGLLLLAMQREAQERAEDELLSTDLDIFN